MTDLTTIPDPALAARLTAGDRSAFTELDRRYRQRLIALLRRRVGCVHDAEDLAQQTLVRACHHIDRHDQRQSLRPWLFTIALRLAADWHRGGSRRQAREAAVATDAITRDNPADRIIAAERHSRLWSIIDRELTPRQRTLLWLHYIEQMTPTEIGQSLSMTALHVRVALHRARRALAPHVVHLDPAAPDPPPHPALALAQAATPGDPR